MKLGIIGGWGPSEQDGFRLHGTEEEFQAFARTLGRRLGELQQAILVGSDDEAAADTHVVHGLIEAAADAEGPLVTVIRGADTDRTPFETERQDAPRLFTTTRRRAAERGAAKLVAVQEADAVITIAGFRPTYYAGLGSIVSGKRVVPVPTFGGASRQLLEIVEELDALAEGLDVGRLDGPRGDDLIDVIFEIAGVNDPPRVMVIHGHDEDRKELLKWLAPRCTVVSMIDELSPGATLPEKYETLAYGADAAIALATPDDRGSSLREGVHRPRARQNVWLEIGWFWGRLGRDRVIVLKRGDVEVPSDYLGIEFLEYQQDPMEQEGKLETFLRLVQRRS